MEDLKKRKLDETDNGQFAASEEELRSFLDPLAKNQLVDLLAKLGCQYPSIAEEIKSIASSDPAHRKLFVRGLAWDTTSETLCTAFQVHGEIEEGAVIIDKATGKSRGYGFVTFKDMESAHSALRAPGKLIDGRLAACNLASEGLSSTSTTTDITQRKLYIGGLSPDTSSEMLLSFFGRHGDIEEGSVAYDKDTNISRGFGFITYKMAEAAKKAIDDPQKTLGGRNITVKFADNHRGKMGSTHIASAMAQVPMPLAAGYPQPGKGYSSTVPFSYMYPQTVATYPTAGYPSPPTMAAQFPTQLQISHSPFNVKKDPDGPSPTTPAGMGGYPFYYAKQ